MNRRFATGWKLQAKAFRDPLEVYTCRPDLAGLTPDTLSYTADKGFVELLARLGVTLFVTREYENLVVALQAGTGKLEQTFLPVPHPSGIAADRKERCLYLAATRNPNQIIEFRPIAATIPRREGGTKQPRPVMAMVRKKYYPGCYYFHDLALIGGRLHAASVGMNGIIRVNLDSPYTEPLAWFPKCTAKRNGEPITTANHIQLNSIAAGADLSRSFFSASGEAVSSRRPGHLNYPVDQRGVIFSGASREVVARGLTRPHSTKLHNGRLWVDNSGYGEFGWIENEGFCALTKLPGWTRGLCFIDDIAFVGVSRVLTKFRRYAPGLKGSRQLCGIFAVSVKSGAVLGSLIWPAGNQIFGIDYLPTGTAEGFLRKSLASNTRFASDISYNGTC